LLLILVALSGTKEDVSLLEVCVSVEFSALAEHRVPKWVQHHSVTALGIAIDDDAIGLLVKAVGPDLPQLAQELEKLANYSAGATVDIDAVSAVVGVRHGETLADLLDAVAARDAPRALGLLPHILQQPKLNVVQILMALTSQTLAIAWGRAARARGRPWGEAVKTYARAIPVWDERSLERGIEVLLEADRLAKDTRLSSEEQLLESVVLTLCGYTDRAAA
jgi:DNA polymerase-3 subunit delta